MPENLLCGPHWFPHFNKEYSETTLGIAHQLGETYDSAIAEMQTIGLSHSVAAKPARFLLDLSADHDIGNDEARLTVTLTHEEIATDYRLLARDGNRLLGEFKKKRVLAIVLCRFPSWFIVTISRKKDL